MRPLPPFALAHPTGCGDFLEASKLGNVGQGADAVRAASRKPAACGPHRLGGQVAGNLLSGQHVCVVTLKMKKIGFRRTYLFCH